MENFQIFFILASFLFGTAIGSFLNVVILRLPQNESLNGRSHCPHCHHILSSPDLLPLFSFLFLLGKCRHCGKKISPRYFIIELLTGLLFALSWWLLQPFNLPGFILLLKGFFIVSTLVAVFVIDLEHYLILDSVVFPALATVTILNFILDLSAGKFIFSLQGNFLNGLVAAALAALPFFAIWKVSRGRWMGFGDVKLALFLGASLGLAGVFVALMLAILLGGAISTILLVFSQKTLKSRLPFGTFLSLGGVVALFYGEKLFSWYLSFLGF